jgi:TolB-like protein
VDFRFAEFEIDLSQQELRRGGEIVHVEPQVFDLLVHLVRHRDRIVSRDELIDTVWNGRVVSEAALSSRINAARRALGDTGNNQAFIRTIHKRGFRFIGEITSGIAAADGRNESAQVRQSTAPLVPDLTEAAERAAVPATRLMRTGVAVLPFTNLSADSENDYFSYGMTEDIIRLLARNRWLTVISRHSTVTFRSRGVDVREVGEALGVKYVLVGSVRRNRDKVRITAELVSSEGAQLWADTYDVQLENIFDIQDEMARQIAATIEPELARVESQLAARKPPDNLDAWDCYQRALWHLWGFTTPGFDEADSLFRRAIEFDPTFARAHGALGYVNVQRALYDEPRDRTRRMDLALEQAYRSVALDERDCFCRCVVGRALSLFRRNDEAAASLDAAIELNPSFAQAYFAQGFNMLWAGKAIEAESLLDRATSLSPRDSHLWSFHHVRAWAHFSLGELDTAAEFARRATHQPNVTYRAFATLAASLGAAGKGDSSEARGAVRTLLERKPDYSREVARQEFFFCRDAEFIDRFVQGLGATGFTSG